MGTMPSEPYLEHRPNGHVTAHLDSVTEITILAHHIRLLFDLLGAYLGGADLNTGNWNGAVAVMDEGWPKIVAQYGDYDVARSRAKALHEAEGKDTIAYALIEAYGTQDAIPQDESGESEECEVKKDKTVSLDDF